MPWASEKPVVQTPRDSRSRISRNSGIQTFQWVIAGPGHDGRVQFVLLSPPVRRCSTGKEGRFQNKGESLPGKRAPVAVEDAAVSLKTQVQGRREP